MPFSNLLINFYCTSIVMMIAIIGAHLSMKRTLNKYAATVLTEIEFPIMLMRNLLYQHRHLDIKIVTNPKSLSDSYNPKKREITISEKNAYKTNISSLAICFHELGHAIQDSDGMKTIRLINFLHPVMIISVFITPVLILLGIYYNDYLLGAGLVTYIPFCLYFLLVLYVEYDANKRAELLLKPALTIKQLTKVKRVLFSSLVVYILFGIFTILVAIGLYFICT